MRPAGGSESRTGRLLEPATTSRALVLVFAAHNVEEFAHLPADRERLLARVRAGRIIEEWYEPDSMAVALVLLTGLAGGLLPLASTSSSHGPEPVADAVALIGSSALAFNAVTHLARSAVEHRYNGGLITAPLMLAGAVALRRGVRERTGLSPRSVRALTLAGVVAVPVLIVAALEAGRRLT